MRKRRSEEEMQAEQTPVMYTAEQTLLRDGIRSSFPDWRGARFFDWRSGWTKMGDYFADGFYMQDEMRELVHHRFGANV